MKPCLSTYGYLEAQVNTWGQRLHASLARQGHTATLDMLRLLIAYTDYFQNQRPRLIYNLRDLFSSGGGFVVPDECEAWLDVHLPADEPIAEIILEMEELLEAQRAEREDLEAALKLSTVEGGYTLPERGPLVEALRATFAARSLEWSPQPFISHSDANQLWAAGVKPILLGCGQLEQAHRPDESIEFAQVVEAAEIYYQTALALETRG